MIFTPTLAHLLVIHIDQQQEAIRSYRTLLSQFPNLSQNIVFKQSSPSNYKIKIGPNQTSGFKSSIMTQQRPYNDAPIQDLQMETTALKVLTQYKSLSS